MPIELVGVGLGRTGTLSLKLALEELLGAPCHHMYEVIEHPEQVPTWHRAIRGEPVDWVGFLAPYSAIVDFPGAAVWADIVAAFPDAPVLLSTRSSPETWWASADRTIIEATRRLLAEPEDERDPRTHMIEAMWQRFSPGWDDAQRAQDAYEAHNAAVRASVPSERLFEYQPGDGWAPLCAALGVAEPELPFPHTNTTEEFRGRAGFDG